MAFTPGAQVGPYQILEQLGQGGMATVYKAYHPALDRYVALKALHPAFMEDPNFLERFRREARVVARLDHPNIVPVYDFSEHEGRPYLVMKFVEGETLKARLQRGPLGLDEIGQIAEAVGAALTYAHEQGVLHRDVKPSNVLLSTDGRIYLTDFGLARIAQAGESTLSSDRLLGTPQYISPEQALGKSDLDARTDIYAFGVMLYEMLLGRVPYNADTPYAIIHDHIYAPLPRPRDLNPNLPPALERVLLKALAKQPEDRFADVPALMEALRQALAEAEGFQAAPAEPPRGLVNTLGNAPTATAEPSALQNPLAETVAVPPEAPEAAPPAPPEAGKAGSSAEAPPETPPARPRRSRRWLWAALGVVVLFGVVLGGALLWARSASHSTGMSAETSHHATATIAPTGVQAIPAAVLADPALADAVQAVKDNPQSAEAWLALTALAWEHDHPSWETLEKGITLARQRRNWQVLADTAEELAHDGYTLPAARLGLAAYTVSPPQDQRGREEALRGLVFDAALTQGFPRHLPFQALNAVNPQLAAAAYARYNYLVAGNVETGDRFFLPLKKAHPDLPEVLLVDAERAFFVEHDSRRALALLQRVFDHAEQMPAWAFKVAREDEALFSKQP